MVSSTAARPELDLARAETIAPVLTSFRPHAVVNAAAYTAVDKAESEPDLAYAINATGAGAVAAAAAAMGVPVMHVSTDYVFDGDKPAPYVEDDPVGPLGVYGASKLAGERAVAAAGPDHVILRTAWVYSPFGTNFVKTMLRLAADRDVVRVVADQWGCPTSAAGPRSRRAPRHRQSSGQSGRAAAARCLPSRRPRRDQLGRLCAAVFAASRRRGGPWARVENITTAEYPTAARRPARIVPRRMPHRSRARRCAREWQAALETCMDRLLDTRSEEMRTIA